MRTSDPTLITYSRQIEVRYRPEILVVGGGPAGIAASLAAAGEGVPVLLIEAHTCLGGLGTAGLVPAFMPFTDGINFLADGIGRRVLDGLNAAGGAYEPGNVVGIRAETLKRLYEALLEEAGIEFVYHTKLVDVVVEESRVVRAVCAGKTGLFAIEAKIFIDGTGDGDLAALAGAPFEQGDESGATMPGTLCSIWAGVDWDVVRSSGLGAGNSRIEQAFADGVFTYEDRHLPGMWRVGDRIGGGNIGHTFGVDGTDEVSLTRSYVWARKSILEYEHYYKKYLAGFESMELVATGSLMGIRESRRIMGDYVLNVDDFRADSTFDDEIGRYSYPVDIHIAKPDKEHYEIFEKEFSSMRLGIGESYGIPYRILTPKRLDNVLVAGRCVSTDRSMQASIRVMPGCYITGQAAGIAAALAAQGGIDSRSIDVGELQRRLKRLGAYLPKAR